ncbi:MAG: glycosyltransferase [Deltaproteobacteria bacterium]|jgi:hypothetical protein|nr:glycosyltransferase [Deltaproteobacteria bacterium]
MCLKQNLAPVVLFTYNRLNCLIQTVEALKKNNLSTQTDLIIYSDGPKIEAQSDDIENIRKYLYTIDGFSSITIFPSKINLGLTESVVSGITETVEKYGKIIVLEDDIVTHSTFLDYMNFALEKYKNDDAVMQISGYFPYNTNNYLPETFFLNHTTSWGWGTWSRAWKYFHLNGQQYIKMFNKDDIQKFNNYGKFDRFSYLIRSEIENIKIWDIYWDLCVYTRNGLTLYPKQSKVLNLGFDGSGTNCTPVKFPQSIDNNYKITSLPNILCINKYANLIFTELSGKFLVKTSIVKNIIKYLLINIFRIDKNYITSVMKKIRKKFKIKYF